MLLKSKIIISSVLLAALSHSSPPTQKGSGSVTPPALNWSAPDCPSTVEKHLRNLPYAGEQTTYQALSEKKRFVDSANTSPGNLSHRITLLKQK